MSTKKTAGKTSFPHRLASGLGMVLLAVVWAGGFMIPPDTFQNTDKTLLLIVITATVIAAWTLLTAVIAAGFFHASSRHPAKTRRGYFNASLRLQIFGILILFPGPLIAQVLGPTMIARTLELFITAISIATIFFGRARLHLIEERLEFLEAHEGEDVSLAPWEEIEKHSAPPSSAT